MRELLFSSNGNNYQRSYIIHFPQNINNIPEERREQARSFNERIYAIKEQISWFN